MREKENERKTTPNIPCELDRMAGSADDKKTKCKSSNRHELEESYNRERPEGTRLIEEERISFFLFFVFAFNLYRHFVLSFFRSLIARHFWIGNQFIFGIYINFFLFQIDQLYFLRFFVRPNAEARANLSDTVGFYDVFPKMFSFNDSMYMIAVTNDIGNSIAMRSCCWNISDLS